MATNTTVLWTTEDWKSEENYLSGYPVPCSAQKIEILDEDKMFSPFIQDSYTKNYFHPLVPEEIPRFDTSKIWTRWIQDGYAQNYFYPIVPEKISKFDVSKVWSRWIQDGYAQNYYHPIVPEEIPKFDINKVYAVWIQDGYAQNYFHPIVPEKIGRFDVLKVFSWWDIANKERMYGYMTPKGPKMWRLGAFAHIKKLKQLEIPLTVTKISDTAFDDSLIEEVTIAPDCHYSEHTFPKTCQIKYWTVNSLNMTSSPNKLIYFLGEELDLTGLRLRASMSDKKDTIERDIETGYTVSGFNNKESGSQTVTITLNNKSISFNVEVLSSESDASFQPTVIRMS